MKVPEEAQRPVVAHRAEPQREPRDLDCHRIDVDAVEAALGDESLQLGQRQVAVVGRVVGDAPREIGGGADQEVPAPHGRIEDVQVEQLVERSLAGPCGAPGAPVEQRRECALHDVVDDVLGGEERPGALAPAGGLEMQPAVRSLGELQRQKLLEDRSEVPD